MNKLCFMLLMCLIILGCKSSLRDKIETKIQEKCKGIETCKIDLKEVTDFKWDRMYFFKTGAEVNKVLGFHYPYPGNDVASRFVFVSGNVVTYHEDNFLALYAPTKEKIRFNFYNDLAPYYCFDAADAIFDVRKTIVNRVVYYELTPQKNRIQVP